MSHFDWTEERVATVKTLWASGHTAGQIREIVGAPTRQSVAGVVCRQRELGKLVEPTRKARTQTSQYIRDAVRGVPANPAAVEARRQSRIRAMGTTAAESPTARLFIDRGHHECAWPLWPDHLPARLVPAAQMLVCAAPTDGEEPYCAHHAGRSRSAAPSALRLAERGIAA